MDGRHTNAVTASGTLKRKDERSAEVLRRFWRPILTEQLGYSGNCCQASVGAGKATEIGLPET